MAIFSPLRSRRFAARQTEATQQLIAFRLRQEWFALPVHAVQKVAQMGKVYGDPQGTGISLTKYQNKELLVVDVGHRIFAEAPNPDLASEVVKNSSDLTQQRFLLIVQSDAGEVVGLPIDSQPAIRRVPGSAFTPLPEAYMVQGNIRCISSKMIQLTNQPPLFLLDPNRLAQRQP